MKKIVSIITALTVFAGSTFADEGMWLLPLLEKMNGKAMKEMGCELTPKQIYDINNTSLKDATERTPSRSVQQFGSVW